MTKIVKITQEDCRPCVQLKNMLNMMGYEVDEEIVVTDENKESVLGKYDIMSTPTMIAFDETGEEIARMSGASVGDIEEFYNKC